MKKITKALVAILLIAVMSTSSVVAFAADAGIDSRLSHTDSAGFSFAVEDNVGYIGITYYGYDSFVRADLNVKIQKRFLLVFWNEVSTWTSTSTDIFGRFYYEMPLDGKGTYYRATFTLEVTGTDGTVDVITDTLESAV